MFPGGGYWDDLHFVPSDLHQDLVYERNGRKRVEKMTRPREEEGIREILDCGPGQSRIRDTSCCAALQTDLFGGSSPLLEDDFDDIWVNGPLMVIGEDSAEMICYLIL